jgi:hypothetical protein
MRRHHALSIRVAFHLPERFFEFAALRSGMRPAGRIKISEDTTID